MNIVILDGGTTNPGDVSWEPIASLGNLTVYDSTPTELVIPRSKDADALIINRIALNKETLEQLPKLRFIGMLATGYNTVDTVAARSLGIPVCNVPLYCVEMVAQQAFTLLLSLCGNVHRYSETVRAGKWQEAVAMNYQGYPLYELYGKTLGIVGYGSIGKCVSKLGLALGMNILLYSRTKKDAPEGCRWVDLDTLFAESDVVSLHCPLNEQTAGLVDEHLLSLMKPTAFLINTSRGGVVDSHALADALNSGKLAGAGVDVMAQEPPAADDPLLTAKNCVISPHIAWASKEARERLIRIVADNLQSFQNGTTQNAVN